MSALWNENIGIPSAKQRTLSNFTKDSNMHGRMDWAAKYIHLLLSL